MRRCVGHRQLRPAPRHRPGSEGKRRRPTERSAMPDRERTRLFDEWADTYDASVTDYSGFPFEGYEEVLATIVRLTQPSLQCTVLDLGIGTGALAERFVREGCLVWGLDFSARMLARAHERVPRAELIKADLSGDWPIDVDQTFSRIVSSYLFHEFPLEVKVAMITRLVGRHLTPGGRVVIGDVSFGNVEERERAHGRWAEAWDDDEHYWAADEASEALQAAGLESTYNQVSCCGGVYVIRPGGAH
ncbi:MAG: methyltransferase domain-containing protein [Candidatus Eisenbacteria bacterium]|nr:methyltransferase domain-containing protein [Candidatus Eisenbacteria bacterium]